MVRYASHVEADGEVFVAAAREQELEGVIAKRANSVYEPGRRSSAWLKIKLRREQELVVAGWLEGQGTHKDLGSLVVAVNDDGRLRHAGQVGSGIDTKTRRELLGALRPIERNTSALQPAPRLPRVHWVEPRIVIRAEFAEWTRDGLVRQSAFKGVEIGKDPASVVREETTPLRRVLTSGSRPPPMGTHRSRRNDDGSHGGDAPDEIQRAIQALDALDKAGEWQVGEETVRVTNLDKVIFPGDPHSDGPDLTKRDLLRHYVAVAPVLVPYLTDRGTTVQRFPDGVAKAGFWQKNLPSHTPKWVERWTFHHREEGPKEYPVVDRPATLAWLAQEAAIELHPWTSPADHPDQPSYALIDIDPGTNTTWDEILILGRQYRTALGHLGLLGVPKVTGKRGIQVWIPVRPGYTFADTRDWVEQLSRAIGQTVPDLISWEWAKTSRRGKARLDFTQNAGNKTLVAPYAVRPAPGAPVSTPISWEELDDPELRPDRWTITNLAERLAKVGDLFSPALSRTQELPGL
jgi:bifunctional non-homologous end joining protein LigD